MRITTQMSHNKSLYYLNSNYSTLSKYSEQVMAERKVLNLSDDPTAAVNGIKVTSSVSRTQQYIRNITSATGSLDIADSQLSSAKSVLDQMKSLITGAANDSYTSIERQAMAIELNEMLSQLLITANAQDGERYIFGGTNSTSEPYTVAGGKYVLYNGNDESINVQTGSSSTTAINVTGSSAFGSSTNAVSSTSLSPGLNLGVDVSTSLDALNDGSGVPKGKIVIQYSAYPDGLEVDLSGCDTLEDVKDYIEKATLEASRNLDPSTCSWLDDSTLDWKDMTDRYVQVTLNADGTGLSLQEYDLGEALPEPTPSEVKKGLDYSGAPGYNTGEAGVAEGLGGATIVCDKTDANGNTFANLKVDNCAGNTVASSLGIKGEAQCYDATNPDAATDGYLHGTALNPVVTKSTLLADLANYNDAVYTITNGSMPGTTIVQETGGDDSNVFNNWNLSNVSAGYNSGTNGELYSRVTRRTNDAGEEELYVEVYAVPLAKAKASDLVASGICSESGGTVKLEEANGSGINGSVGIVLGSGVDQAKVDLCVDFGDGFQGVVNVPAFREETDAAGVSLDYLNILSGWSITGLEKPSANDNDSGSTDPSGDLSVRLAEVTDATGNTSLQLQLYRPAFGDQPETLVATGELELDGESPLGAAQSGRIAISGVEGFESISGSVYVELPANEDFDSLEYTLTATFATVEDLMRAVQESGTYTNLQITSDGQGLEFTSNLAGAYLTVSEDTDCYEQMGDTYQQLSGLDLNGLVKGVNSDSGGALYTEVAYYPPDPSRSDGKAVLLSDDGTQTLIDAGYYVRVYSNADALGTEYENRDESSLVAQGYLPYDSVPAGEEQTLTLEAKNGSGLSGTVSLDYYGDRPVDTDLAEYNNSGISINPGGLRASQTLHTTMQQIEIPGFTAGVHADYAGTAHGVVSYENGTTTVSLYKDASRTHMTAKGELNGKTGQVVFYETDKNGNYMLDIDGNRIEIGTMQLAENTLSEGQSDTFTLEAGGVDASGQERESNIFSTIYDAIDALNANDVDALHNLIDVFQEDIDRLLSAEADVASRSSRLALLSERYEVDVISYQTIYTNQVGMDSDGLATVLLGYTAAENAYNASLQVASRYLQMSLLDYL